MSFTPAQTRASTDLAAHWVTLERSRTIAAVLLDSTGSILRCNELFRETLLGDAPLGKANLATWLDSADGWPAVIARSRAAPESVVRLVVPDRPDRALRGELIETAIETGSPCVVGLFTPCAEIESAQAIMARNARLEALVCLTSGVAHDFNNLLTVLGGNLSLAAEEVRSQPSTFAKLKSARDAASRGGALIRQLLAFARQKELGSELIDPARIVRTIAPLIERALGGNVELELDIDESAGQIHASAVQFESAVVNLAVNARDALDGTGHVRIAVLSGNGSSGRGATTRIIVADNGPGIPSDLVAKVLQPFFTTKSESGGTGLGLSMVDAFARQHGGALEISSDVGKGTTITLTFPRAGDNIDDSVAATMPLLALPAGTETIIAVARDKSLLATVEQVLNALGYTVHCAETLPDANELIREHRPELILTDGFDVRALMQVHAGAESGGCSGLELVSAADVRAGAATSSARNAPELPMQRLAKPFSVPELARTVRTLLDSRSSRALPGAGGD